MIFNVLGVFYKTTKCDCCKGDDDIDAVDTGNPLRFPGN